MKTINIKLGPREEEIMEHFWEHGPLFVKELIEFYPEPKPHFNTISTFVRGLEEKEMVSHKAFGNAHQYYATVKKEEFGTQSMKGILNKYFDNSILSAVSSLVSEKGITDEEAEQLMKIIKQGNK